MSAFPPLTVEILRGETVESRHTIHAVMMNGKGEVTAAYGDMRRITYPRSTIKPLQAIAMVESGAAEAFDLSDEEIALTCASHGGEEKHQTRVAAWLKRLGLSDADLECGAHAPYSSPQSPPCVLCNNCSGKHTGMLTLALFMKTETKGYTDPNHPVQKKILGVLSDMCGETLTPAVCGIDGCSAPNPVMQLQSIALGYARFMNPASLPKARQEACRRIYKAMTAHPDLVSGAGRLDNVLMSAGKGRLVTKVGAEALHSAIIPEKDTVVVLKAEDGTARASQAALADLLERHRLVDDEVIQAARPLAQPVLKNWRGTEVGRVRVAG